MIVMIWMEDVGKFKCWLFDYYMKVVKWVGFKIIDG